MDRIVLHLYRFTLLFASFALIIYALAGVIFLISIAEEAKNNNLPSFLMLNAIFRFFLLLVLLLVIGQFFFKRYNFLKEFAPKGAFPTFCRIVSVFGLALFFPWLYFYFKDFGSWFAEIIYSKYGHPFDFWVFVMAIGIASHELLASEPSTAPTSDQPTRSPKVDRAIKRPVEREILFP